MRYNVILRAKEFPHRVRNVIFPADTTEELCSYIISVAADFWLLSAVLLPIESERPGNFDASEAENITGPESHV